MHLYYYMPTVNPYVFERAPYSRDRFHPPNGTGDCLRRTTRPPNCDYAYGFAEEIYPGCGYGYLQMVYSFQPIKLCDASNRRDAFSVIGHFLTINNITTDSTIISKESGRTIIELFNSAAKRLDDYLKSYVCVTFILTDRSLDNGESYSLDKYAREFFRNYSENTHPIMLPGGVK